MKKNYSIWLTISGAIVIIAFFIIRTSMHAQCLATSIHSPRDIAKLFAVTPQSLNAKKDQYIEQARKEFQKIIEISPEKRTYANTILAFDNLTGLSNLEVWGNLCEVVQMTNPDTALREMAQKVLIEMQAFWIDTILNNKKIYEAFKQYAQLKASQENLTDEQKYYLHETLDYFEKAGLGLPDDQLQILGKIKKELAELAIQFEKNIATDNRTVAVKREDLTGLDDDFINQLPKNDEGLILLGMDYPTVNHVLANCTNEAVRKNLSIAFNNRAYPANEQVLKNVVVKRFELAKLVGYKTFADLDLSDQMVKSPERADKFLADLFAKAKEKEAQEFKQITAQLPQSISLVDGKLKPWDVRFVQNEYKKKHFNVDERLIQEYFPMEKTVEALLDIYRQFLSINLKEVSASDFWSPDVKVIEVSNLSGEILGYLLLDLFPRPNKYTHACHISVIKTVTRGDEFILAVSVVLANFPKPTADKPALFKRDDVNTFFHEFGHALHAVLGSTYMSTMAGTSVKRDFVELPSQMLEEWLWDPIILKKVSSHYQTGKPLSDELINQILKLKQFDTGSQVGQQIYYAMLSLSLYDNGPDINLDSLVEKLYKTYRLHTMFDPMMHGIYSFGHLMGYAAKYYGYLWSRVFALDMFETIKNYGLLNPEIGLKYIDAVLSKGGSKDPNELLKTFLGREPNQKAFLHSLGLNNSGQQ